MNLGQLTLYHCWPTWRAAMDTEWRIFREAILEVLSNHLWLLKREEHRYVSSLNQGRPRKYWLLLLLLNYRGHSKGVQERKVMLSSLILGDAAQYSGLRSSNIMHFSFLLPPGKSFHASPFTTSSPLLPSATLYLQNPGYYTFFGISAYICERKVFQLSSFVFHALCSECGLHLLSSWLLHLPMSSVCHPLPPLLRPVDFRAPTCCTTPPMPHACFYPQLHFLITPFPCGEYFYNFLGVNFTSLCTFPHPRRPTAVLLWCSVRYLLLSVCMPLSAIQPLLHAGFTSVFASGFLYNFLCVVYMLGCDVSHPVPPFQGPLDFWAAICYYMTMGYICVYSLYSHFYMFPSSFICNFLAPLYMFGWGVSHPLPPFATL